MSPRKFLLRSAAFVLISALLRSFGFLEWRSPWLISIALLVLAFALIADREWKSRRGHNPPVDLHR